MKVKTLKWKEILDELQEEIVKNNLHSGDKFHSLKEVCIKYDVSLITAKRVFSELENDCWIKKTRGKGTFITKSRLPVVIKLILSHGDSPEQIHKSTYSTLRVYNGILEAAKEAGIQVQTFGNFPFWKDSRNEYFVFLTGIDKKSLSDVSRKNTVVLAYSLEQKKCCSTVRSDLQKGGYIATKHLLSLGHTRIGFVTGLLSDPWLTSRFEGYMKALGENRINLDWKLIQETVFLQSEETHKAVKRLLSLENPPTAIFATNDTRALHILEYCSMNNIKVPEDLSVIGFDNVPECEISSPPLTTIETNLFQQGKEAVFLMLELAGKKSGNRDILIEPELVVRNSTRQVK